MAGRKKVTEEAIGTEVQAVEGVGSPSAGEVVASANETGMNLNELLGSMDQEQENTAQQGNVEQAVSVGEGLDEATTTEKGGTDVENTDTEGANVNPVEDTEPEKPKRTSRKSKPVESKEDSATEDGTPTAPAVEDGASADKLEETIVSGVQIKEDVMPVTDDMAQILDGASVESTEPADTATEQTEQGTSRRPARVRKTEASVLTLDNHGEVQTEEAREDVIWHEIHNAYRTRRILTGQLGGIEQTDGGKTIVIVDYKGFRIVIPIKEMMINLGQGRSPSGKEYAELMLRQNKILGNMLGAQIDFVVRGIDSKTRSVVASRREAMLKKRQIFYLDTDAEGMYRIYEGRIVEARVIAVAEKVVRVEVFGVECSIMARDLAWDWIGDAHERFSVGDQVLVRILSVRRDSLEDIGIKADIKSVTQDTHHENLKKCRVQSKYAGKVTDVHKGVVYIRLSNGVNAVAHSCNDYRTPGKKDDVSFAVTKIDEERGVAVGIITRIIRQNL